MTQRLPSDTLAKPTRRAPWIIGSVVTLGIAVSAFAFGPAVAAQLAPTPTASATVAAVSTDPLSDSDFSTIQQAATDQQAQIVADQKAADAAAAAQAAAAKAAQHHSSSIAAGAPGSRVPFIASSDPNNANGGDYEDPGTYCDSHSASGNPPVCD